MYFCTKMKRMMKKVLAVLILILTSTKMGHAQLSQSELTDSLNFKLNRINDAISKYDKSEFMRLQDEVLLLTDKLEDTDNRFIVYALSINNYYTFRCFDEAVALSLASLDKARHCYGEKHKEVAEFLLLLAFSYAHNNQIQKAIDYGEQSVQMYEDLGAVQEEEYFMSVMLLTSYYNENNKYPESILMLKKCLSLIGVGNIPPERLATVYRSLAVNYSSLNNYLAAQAYTIKALELYEDKQSLNYLELEKSLAWLYSNNGNHDEAIRLINEVCDCLKAKNDKYFYTLALCDKASIYIHSQKAGMSLEAIRFAEESVRAYEADQDTLSEHYIHSLMTLAEAYKSIDLLEHSQEIYKRVYSLQKQFLDTSDIDDLEILSYSAVLAGNLQDGLHLFQQLKDFVLQEKGSNSVDYANIELQVSGLYCQLHDYELALRSISEAFPTIRGTLAKSFFFLDDKERAGFWEKYSHVFNGLMPRMCYTVPDARFPGLMFNASLLSKNILLNTERLMRNLIAEKSSVEDYLNPFFMQWQDIQSKLKKDDIAIEFIKVDLLQEVHAYMAVTIRSGYEMPKLTRLFSEDELHQVSDTLYYQCKEMSDLVWKPLQRELKGIKNIYFSPSGALYNIGIEYLPGMEEYNIYRLSSTRELAIKKQMDTGENAVLYGGLDFYAELDTSNVSKGTQLIDSVFVEHANVRDMKLRGAQGYLPETKIEVERISKEFDKANKPCQLFTEKVGTEESFKALSGKKINNLHISTHGFYYSQEDADRIDYDFLRPRGDFQSAEDKSLTRSGLLMAGANHILEGDTLPDNVEDGILTAKEIADVDLRGLDLVVLSACQTGLGDISKGEGVFGLQRGFKKAGANTILMSLWKVDDKATQILMTQFYKNFLSGQSKRQSLFSAQKYLREYDNGKYDDPKYWAAFVLLDGIEWKEGQK